MIEQHSFLINLSKGSTLTSNNQVTEKTIYCVDPSLENFVDWTDSFVTSCLNDYFYYVSTSCAAIDISICIIDGNTVNSTFDLTKLNIKFRETTCFRV
jgi:hypothetical protein